MLTVIETEGTVVRNTFAKEGIEIRGLDWLPEERLLMSLQEGLSEFFEDVHVSMRRPTTLFDYGLAFEGLGPQYGGIIVDVRTSRTWDLSELPRAKTKYFIGQGNSIPEIGEGEVCVNLNREGLNLSLLQGFEDQPMAFEYDETRLRGDSHLFASVGSVGRMIHIKATGRKYQCAFSDAIRLSLPSQKNLGMVVLGRVTGAAVLVDVQERGSEFVRSLVPGPFITFSSLLPQGEGVNLGWSVDRSVAGRFVMDASASTVCYEAVCVMVGKHMIIR